MLRASHPTITRGARLTERLRLDARIFFIRRTATPKPSGSGQRAGDSLFHASIAAAILVAVILLHRADAVFR